MWFEVAYSTIRCDKLFGVIKNYLFTQRNPITGQICITISASHWISDTVNLKINRWINYQI